MDGRYVLMMRKGGRGMDLDTKEGVESGGVEEGSPRESCQRTSEDGGQSTGSSGVVPHIRTSRCHRNIPIAREEERVIPGILEADDRVGSEKEEGEILSQRIQKKTKISIKKLMRKKN